MFPSWLRRLWLVAALLSCSLHGQTIVQPLANANGDGGNGPFSGNLGQTFLPSDSGISAGTAYLVSFTFFKSGAGVPSTGSRYLHIATSMSAGIESGFVGSSTNAVSWDTTSSGDPLVFNFSNLGLDPNTIYFALFSTSPTAGNLAAGALMYYNINIYAAGTLLHDAAPYSFGDAEFTATFSAVPEPAMSAALVGVMAIGLAWYARKKRRKTEPLEN